MKGSTASHGASRHHHNLATETVQHRLRNKTSSKGWQLLLVLLICAPQTLALSAAHAFQRRQEMVCKWMSTRASYSSSVLRSYVMRTWHAGKPFGVGCAGLERFGNQGDGGKALCEPDQLLADPECRIVSIGVNADVSFEMALHERGRHCAIDAYDGTLSAMKVHYIGKVAPFLNVTRSNFHNLSWVPYAKSGAVPVVTMLKMDCEGCEFSTLRPWLAHVCAKHILIEVHGCTAPPAAIANDTHALNTFYRTRLFKMHQLMTDLYEYGYRVFHNEYNVEYSDGTCVEYALRRETPCPTKPGAIVQRDPSVKRMRCS